MTPSTAAEYVCAMCPSVESDKPRDRPECGMALERNPTWQPPKKVICACPMHPEVEQDHPDTCPKCSMALEAKAMTADVEENDSELRDMTRRLWIGATLTVP